MLKTFSMNSHRLGYPLQGCVHRALFCLTVRVQVEHTQGKKRMIFRAYASKNPGVWGWPQGALLAQRRNNGNRKFTIFAIQLLPRIKTVADPSAGPPSNRNQANRRKMLYSIHWIHTKRKTRDNCSRLIKNAVVKLLVELHIVPFLFLDGQVIAISCRPF